MCPWGSFRRLTNSNLSSHLNDKKGTVLASSPFYDTMSNMFQNVREAGAGGKESWNCKLVYDRLRKQ